MADTWDGWTMRAETVRCGKRKCKSCPHGPYWYGYRSEDGKQRKRYFGRKHPGEDKGSSAGREGPGKEPLTPPHPHDRIFDKREASARLALDILGIEESAPNWSTILRQYRKQVAWWHPDRGGSDQVMKRLNVAFELLKERLKP